MFIYTRLLRNWRVENLHCALRLNLRVVARQLQADADVVLHPAHLAAERDAVLLEGVGSELELVRVDLHLLPEAQEHALFVAGGQGFPDVDPALLEHDDGELAHGVLHLVGGQDPDPVVLLVDVEAGVGQEAEGPLVVLCGGVKSVLLLLFWVTRFWP